MPQICFPNHVGLPFQPNPPTPDGYVEPEPWMANNDFGLDADLVDPGWTGASRITFLGTVSGGLGSPAVAFQGIKERTANYIHLCFVVRRDASFDNNDVIVLVLHPNFATGSIAKTGDERRIHIFPNRVGVGVDAPATTSNVTFGAETWRIRENGMPKNDEYYRWVVTPPPVPPLDPPGRWVAHSPATPSRPNNITIKVRSWTTNTPNQYNWSVEVRLPTNTTEGGTGWINLGTNFGFYFNVVRLVSDPSGLATAIQFPWPGPTTAAPTAGILSDGGGVLAFNEIDVPPSWLGEALLGSSACTQGVRFKNGTGGIGVGAWSGPGSLSNAIARTSTNIFTARLVNGGPATANNIQAEFRIANWGIGPGGTLRTGTPFWNKIPATDSTTNPTTPFVNLAAGGEDSATMKWTLTPAERAQYGTTLHNHQCIWVRLESSASAIFAESSVRTNFEVQALSAFEQEAEVSGVGYPDPAAGSADQDMLLFVSQMIIPRYRRDGQGDDQRRPLTELLSAARRNQEVVNLDEYLKVLQTQLADLVRDINSVEYRYVWITDGFRNTGLTLTIDGTQYKTYEPADSFGYIGTHTGPVADWGFQVSEVGAEGRLEAANDAVYRLRVPNGGAVRILTRLEAIESPFDRGGCRMVIQRLFEQLGPLGRIILRRLGWT